MGGLLFAAASSVTSCVMMWVSAAYTLRAADSFASAAAIINDGAARARALEQAASVALYSSRFNSYNNTFLLVFYSVYATACLVVAAIVFQTLQSLLHSIDSQKILLDETEDSDASKHLVAINDAADLKSRRLRVVLCKVALNCSVVVVAAVFSLFIDSISVVEGLMDVSPPPPCPSGADECDSCELHACAVMQAFDAALLTRIHRTLLTPLLHATRRRGCSSFGSANLHFGWGHIGNCTCRAICNLLSSVFISNASQVSH
jgi:hypothetical protein